MYWERSVPFLQNEQRQDIVQFGGKSMCSLNTFCNSGVEVKAKVHFALLVAWFSVYNSYLNQMKQAISIEWSCGGNSSGNWKTEKQSGYNINKYVHYTIGNRGVFGTKYSRVD